MKKKKAWTHIELCKRAERWLRGTKRCSFTMIEQPHAYLPEVPDVIGWSPGDRVGTSCHVVECKTSAQDCSADKRKKHAQWGESMGDFRWIFAPGGMLTVAQIPPLHGLAEVRGNKIYIVKHAPPRDKTWARLEAEVTYLRVELCDQWQARRDREAS